MARRRGADFLIESLVKAGTRHVFALSGNHAMPVFDAALEAKLSLIHVRHEAAAVHMADAWGRLTGEVGVALVTGGPGHANALSALYTALAGESPLLLISGHAPLNELGKGAFQEMAQADIAAPLAKASWTAQAAAGLGEDVARAFRTALSGRPGPVHLSVPNDVLDAAVDAVVPAKESFLKESRSIDAPMAAVFLQTLGAATRPLVIAGPALSSARGRAALRSLQEASGIPAIVMESPRGVNDPSLGRLAKVLAQADAVLLLGKRRDFTLKFGRAFAEGCRVLEVNGDVDAMASVQRLASLAERTRSPSWLEEVHAALRFRPAAWQTLKSSGAALHAVEVCRAAQKLLDSPEAVLVSDGGEFGQWAQACLSAPHRVINGPAGSIGAALPFAAAAKLAFPDSTVLAALGDGTFGFHMAEIETALRCRLPYIALVGNDACWNAEYQIQLRAYGKDRAHGLDLLPVKYGAVAAAMGAYGADVSSLSHLESELQKAKVSGVASVVNVAIERAAAPTY
ncbi:MAG: thiamine pyrophosphate-binding protein [Betaproteobacteria bacterium]